MAGVFSALDGICHEQGLQLGDAATANVDKISKRLEQNSIRGDGSHREEPADVKA